MEWDQYHIEQNMIKNGWAFVNPRSPAARWGTTLAFKTALFEQEASNVGYWIIDEDHYFFDNLSMVDMWKEIMSMLLLVCATKFRVFELQSFHVTCLSQDQLRLYVPSWIVFQRCSPTLPWSCVETLIPRMLRPSQQHCQASCLSSRQRGQQAEIHLICLYR